LCGRKREPPFAPTKKKREKKVVKRLKRREVEVKGK
jgi:hypothetical protein